MYATLFEETKSVSSVTPPLFMTILGSEDPVTARHHWGHLPHPHGPPAPLALPSPHTLPPLPTNLGGVRTAPTSICGGRVEAFLWQPARSIVAGQHV